MSDAGKIPPAGSSDGGGKFASLMPIACGVFGLSVLLEILSRRCLYADGAHEFIKVLQAQGFVELMWSRHFGFDVFEFPLVIALKLGVTNLYVLQLAFGLGCFLPWPVALMFCRWLSPENFWLVVVACAAGYLNAAFMPVGEHILAHAFFWPALFVILFARPLTPLASAVLLTSALVLMFSYESLLFLGPPLAALAAWRALRENEGFWQRSMLLASAALFVAAAVVALDGVLQPELPLNMGGFSVDAEIELAHPAWTIGWSAGWLALMAAICISPAVRRLAANRAGIALGVCAIALWGAWPLLAPHQLNPADQHRARFLDTLVPLLLLPVAWIQARRPAWMELCRPQLVTLTAAFLLAQSLWQIGATWQWHRYVGTLRGVLATRAGPILPGTISAQPLQFDWYWANPCLSLALNPGGKVNAILLPEHQTRFVPFDPFIPGDLPKLERYGIDYSGYLSALAKFRVKLKELHLSTNGISQTPFW